MGLSVSKGVNESVFIFENDFLFLSPVCKTEAKLEDAHITTYYKITKPLRKLLFS